MPKGALQYLHMWAKYHSTYMDSTQIVLFFKMLNLKINKKPLKDFLL
jgi:hypothetical protein